MDDDIGGQLADSQHDEEWYAEHGMCPDCEATYDANGGCDCGEVDWL